MKQLVLLAAVATVAVSVFANCGSCGTKAAAATCEEGFVSLFDGKSLSGWISRSKPQPPSKGWEAQDGVLTVLPKDAGGGCGDIITEKKYSDFIFKLEFRLTKNANSGIKYLYDPKLYGGTTMEYQVLDPGHPDATKGRDGNRTVASLYDVLPAGATEKLKPAGEWNEAMIVVKGMHVEHWLNGEKVLEFERGSDTFNAEVAKSKFNKHKDWGTQTEGHILLQDHNDRVSYRNIRIKELK